MKRDPLLYIDDILESIELIRKYVDGCGFSEFEEDTKLQDAVYRRVEIIGEASKNLPKSIKEEYPELQWDEMAGTRDVLAHAYHRVSPKIVWDAIETRLPELKKKMENLKKRLELAQKKNGRKNG